MRIGAILPHLLVFGGVRRYLELGNEFVARGHCFTIYTADGARPGWLPFAGEVLPHGALPGRDHDVLICGSSELTSLLDAGRSRERVFYLQIEGVEDEERIVRSGRYRIMVNSSGLARRVRNRYGVEPIDGRGGVNPRLFHPVAERPSAERFRVLAYGRLSKPRKGTRFVARAVRMLARSGVPVELHLFDTLVPGSPDPRIGFDPGVPYRFYIDLPQERMAAMYGAADVFVSAEHRAGWSNTTAEAAACALPLVCTSSGTADFAVDARTAIILRTRTASSIARSLARLARDRELSRALGEAARRRILEFTWDAVCARMERAFGEILSSGARS